MDEPDTTAGFMLSTTAAILGRCTQTAMSQPADSQEGPQPEVQPDGRRRKFLGAGAAVAPAVLTLTSQPALGVTCFTPSRSLSRNTSVSQQGKFGECRNAESPGNYKTHQNPNETAYHWPRTPRDIPPSTLFHSVFSGSKFMKPNPSGLGYISMSMGEVLNLNGQGDPEKIAFHLIGAYLNINGGNGAVISPAAATEATVKRIWDEWIARGYYEPTAGVKWYGPQIKNYLLSNGIIA